MLNLQQVFDWHGANVHGITFFVLAAALLKELPAKSKQFYSCKSAPGARHYHKGFCVLSQARLQMTLVSQEQDNTAISTG